MKTRVPLPAVILVALAFLLGAALLRNSPRTLYTRTSVQAYNAALSKWQSAGPAAYTIVVASNSLTQPTGGWNTIRVQNSMLLEAHNPDCPECSPEVFAPLTVEALFRRIQAECLLDFPFQFCSVSYHDTIGYPVRLDTYSYTQSGVERPSITVQSVEPFEP